jgi:hypothetical protein
MSELEVLASLLGSISWVRGELALPARWANACNAVVKLTLFVCLCARNGLPTRPRLAVAKQQ